MIDTSLLIKGFIVAIVLGAAIAGYYYFGAGSPIEQDLVKLTEDVVKQETGTDISGIVNSLNKNSNDPTK